MNWGGGSTPQPPTIPTLDIVKHCVINYIVKTLVNLNNVNLALAFVCFSFFFIFILFMAACARLS